MTRKKLFSEKQQKQLLWKICRASNYSYSSQKTAFGMSDKMKFFKNVSNSAKERPGQWRAGLTVLASTSNRAQKMTFAIVASPLERYEDLGSHKLDFPDSMDIPFRLEFSDSRIQVQAHDRLIFDIEDRRCTSGQFGICTSNLGNADVHFEAAVKPRQKTSIVLVKEKEKWFMKK